MRKVSLKRKVGLVKHFDLYYTFKFITETIQDDVSNRLRRRSQVLEFILERMDEIN